MSENHISDDTNPRPASDRRTATGETPMVEARRPAPPPRRQGGGCGCWITALFALFIAAMLVIAGLFLPPVNLYDRLFGIKYVMLNADQNAYATNDQSLTLVLNPDDTGEQFGVLINTIALNDFVSGSGAEWVPVVQASVPPYLALQSQVYDVQMTGTAPDNLSFDLQIPPNVANADTLDVYGWYDDRWQFLPAQLNTAGKLTVSVDELPQRVALFQAAPLDPVVLTPVDITETLTDRVGLVSTIVSPAGLQPNVNGALVGSLAPGFDLNAGYKVMPVIRNFADPGALDIATVEAILGNSGLRATHVQQIAAVASNGGYDGVFIDYRDLPVAQRDNFSAFIAELKNNLRGTNLQVGVMVPAAENQNGVWETGAYNWRAIGAEADYLVVDFNLDPKTFAPGADRLVEAMLRWAKGEVSRYKLIAGLNALSTREISGSFAPVGFDTALAALGDVTIEAETSETGTIAPGTPIVASLGGQGAVPGIDTETRTPFVEYMNEDETVASRVWLMTGDALRFRMDRVGVFAIGGVSLDDLVADGLAEDVLATVMNYKLRVPVQEQRQELALRWRIADANGLVSEVVTELNEDLVLTLEPGQEGNFAVQVDIVGGDLSSARSSAQVLVAAPTNTPTPLPTNTPTPIPTVTPTLEVIQPTVERAPGDNTVGNFNPGPAVSVGPGAIAGGFEYGGHVTSTSSEIATSAMKSAGMTWMKVQVGYFPGKNPGDVASIIGEARARGFKVLLGVVGNKNDLQAGGAGYIQEFASFLGGVAAQGPDAIEVWNEPNIDREWPTGEISGANYTSMLAAAYNAIKSNNSSVMVISAALAPTGFFGTAGCAAGGCNDDRFLTDMFAAGAGQYMDCLGMHYNEGIVGPNQTTGDPRDNFYSRYFWSMVNLYSSFGKTICITELGYLTPEGFPPLSPFWGWAQNTTVAQQASWLAEAIALASTSGKVRMLIVWNIDFSGYDANDPQGGYAIIRPGGGCPACGAIAGAR